MEQTIINSAGYPIFIGNDVFNTIRSYLLQYEFKEDKIFILCDEGSRKYCLPVLMSNVQLLQKVAVLEIPAGEENKNIDACKKLWTELSNRGADRNSILINLGGGVISDMGGFAASTFKRGIRYLNIPTTLLAMVDASIGGKVGVDLNNLKNQIGLFSNPQVVFIIPEFLDTLPKRYILSGFAEIIKHALIYDKSYWQELSSKCYDEIEDWKEFIDWSVEVKNYYITEDPLDTGFRKVLNFGHTLGHAFETYSLYYDDESLLHGEAVAIGIICEAYISYKVAGLKKDQLEEIAAFIIRCFSPYILESDSIDILLDFIKHDKKKLGSQMNLTLLSSIGTSLINQECSTNIIRESIQYYQNLVK
jgi:3-dehydroquinate synthase